MKYVLGLGIKCKKYKKNPTIKIFLNNILLDEYNLHGDEKDISLSFSDINPISRREIIRTSPFCNKIKFYTINNDILYEENNLTIDVINDDSNYTNGFITRSTLIDFNTLVFFPKKYCLDSIKSLKTFDGEVMHPYNMTHDKGLGINFKEKNNEIEHYVKGWPYPWFVDWCPTNENEIVQILSPKKERWIGGSGQLKTKIIHKYGIYQFDNNNAVINFDGDGMKAEKYNDYKDGWAPAKGWSTPSNDRLFPIAMDFLGLCAQQKINKYLHENQ